MRQWRADPVGLLAPESQAGAHYWAAVLLSHGLIGAALAALFAAVMAWRVAVPGVSLGYAVAWEGAAQRLGAGLLDAAVDSLAVACGALMAWGLWRHRWRLIGGPGAALAAVLALGVWRRRKGPEA
jgi:hypothetical protein